MDNDDVEEGNSTQDEVDALRRFRAGFLDVAIAIEFDIRVMLASYFVADDSKMKLFLDVYEGRGTLGPMVQRFKKVLAAAREDFPADSGFSSSNVDALCGALDELVENRNRFAHHPMGSHLKLDTETGQVIGTELRIGRGERYFTVDTAREAYESALRCEDLVLRVRKPIAQIILRS
jgi:hypothetical protein